jgi:hypothetical protein
VRLRLYEVLREKLCVPSSIGQWPFGGNGRSSRRGVQDLYLEACQRQRENIGHQGTNRSRKDPDHCSDRRHPSSTPLRHYQYTTFVHAMQYSQTKLWMPACSLGLMVKLPLQMTDGCADPGTSMPTVFVSHECQSC